MQSHYWKFSLLSVNFDKFISINLSRRQSHGQMFSALCREDNHMVKRLQRCVEKTITWSNVYSSVSRRQSHGQTFTAL